MILPDEIEKLQRTINDLVNFLQDGPWTDFDTQEEGHFDWADEHLVQPALKLICEHIGHVPIMDHCRLPQHDYCARCREMTPGEAHKKS